MTTDTVYLHFIFKFHSFFVTRPYAAAATTTTVLWSLWLQASDRATEEKKTRDRVTEKFHYKWRMRNKSRTMNNFFLFHFFRRRRCRRASDRLHRLYIYIVGVSSSFSFASHFFCVRQKAIVIKINSPFGCFVFFFAALQPEKNMQFHFMQISSKAKRICIDGYLW